MNIEYPALLELRGSPVGVVSGLSVYGNIIFSTMAQNLMFVGFDDFVDHVASKQRPVTRNMRHGIEKDISLVFQDTERTPCLG